MKEQSTLILLNVKSHVYNLYLKASIFISSILSLYIGLEASIKVLGFMLLADSLTRIEATRRQKKIKFNPFKKEFWFLIKSKGLKLMLNKALMQYGIYFFIAYILDVHILKQMTIITFQNIDYTLPVVTLWVCIAIEIWSIGENIEDAGGVNLPKRIIHFFDEKYQKIFKKTKEDE